MNHCLLYIPGLGDAHVAGQNLAVRTWRLQGVEPELFALHWIDGEPFAPKLERLLARIDRLHAKGHTVSLVAASAGAGAALNAYAARPQAIHGVVTICGQILGPQHVADSVYRQNPAFHDSMRQLPTSLKLLDSAARRRILSIRPLADESVPPGDTRLDGAVQRVMPSVGHALSIGLGLTAFSPLAIGFLKRLPESTLPG